MKATFWGSLLATVLAAGSIPTQAEDIDLFIQPANTGSLPNVLILLDNTANWSRNVGGQAIFINEKLALKHTFENLATNPDGSAKFRVGLMLFTETGGGNSGDDGGYVRMAIRDMNTANKAKYAAMINSLDQTADKSNGGKSAKTMSEAYQYFSGLAPFAGNNKVKTDYTGNNTGTAASNAVYALPGNAIPSKPGTPYTSPIADGSCAQNYIIYISNGAAQDPNADNTTATTRLSAAATAEGITGATNPISLTPSGSASNVADEWARFMTKSSKNIITYTIDVDRITTGQGPGWTRLLQAMAGDTKNSVAVPDGSNPRYYSLTSGNGGANLEAGLGDIFSKIQAKNSVFASVSLPVSVNTEGTYLNQVYIGQFRPDKDAKPRWYGNLKQYKLAKVGNTLRTVDAYGYVDTINPATGFIDKCARSYWTGTSTDTYWAFAYPTTDFLDAENIDVCDTIPAIGADAAIAIGRLPAAQSNRPDGNFVEKGAAGQKLRAMTSRTVKTCTGDCSGGLVDLATTTFTGTALGVTDAERAALISWAKGTDTLEENANSNITEMRPSAHGDVLHSRPVAIDFRLPATNATCVTSPTDPLCVDPRVYVFYAGNDGMLRAINGNRTLAISGVTAGSEAWSFVPPEFVSRFKDLRANNVEIDYEGSTTTPTQSKPYGMDGPLSAYRNASGSTTWLFAGMRRGGRAIYAFDMSHYVDSTPTAPTLMWKAGCGVSGCSGSMSDMGQSWSAPKIHKAAGFDSGNTPLVIFGGGYDACQDSDTPSCSGATGDHIYILDASDGSVEKRFDTDSQVVGDVIMITDPSTGYVRWGYAADMAGNVYRISGNGANTIIGSTPPGNWQMTKIASLGCATTATCTNPRKFMFAPGVVDENGSFVLLIGSGDREKPLRTWTNTYAVANYMFMLRDNPADDTWLDSEQAVDRCNAEIICLNSLTAIANGAADPSDADLAGKKGWYLGLNAHEQVVTTALTVFGTTTFSTHTPVPATGNQCLNTLGTARVYNISYKNAATQNGTVNRSEEISGGGLPPSPVAGMVRLDDGSLVPFLIGGDPDSPLQSLLPTGPEISNQPKAITYWYIQK